MDNIKTEFSNYLKLFLSNTEISNRSFWSQILNVSTSAISQWTTGKTIPLPKQLNRILSVLYDFENLNRNLMKGFNEFISLFDIKLNEFERKKFKNHETIGDYIVEPKLIELSEAIKSLPFELKNELILFFTRFSIKSHKLYFNNSESTDSILSVFQEIENYEYQQSEEIVAEESNTESFNLIINEFYEKLIYLSSSIVDDYITSELIVNQVFEEIVKKGFNLWLNDTIVNFNGNIELALYRRCKILSIKNLSKNKLKAIEYDFEIIADNCIHSIPNYETKQPFILNDKEKIVMQGLLINGWNHKSIALHNEEIKSETESILSFKKAKSKLKDIFLD